MELQIRGVSKTYPNSVLIARRTVAHVNSETPPGTAFEDAEQDLKDVYFGTMAGHIGRRRAAYTAPAFDD
jgi:hypothetical protein